MKQTRDLIKNHFQISMLLTDGMQGSLFSQREPLRPLGQEHENPEK